MWLRRLVRLSLVAGFTSVLAVATASDNAASGSVEGQVTIAPDSPVQLADPGNETNTPDYSSVSLLIRSVDEGKHTVKVTPDRAGKYRATLPPGQYVIELQQHRARPLRTTPQRFSVTPDTTTRVDIAVAPDVRKVGPQQPDIQ